MFKLSDGKICTREVLMLLLFGIGVKITDSTPEILYETGKNAAWLMNIVSAVVMLIPYLLILSVLKQHEGQSFFEVVYSLTGRTVGFFLGMTLFVIQFFSLLSNTRDDIDILSTMFFPRTPILVLYSVVMFSVYYIARRGLENITRGCWFFYGTLQFVIIVLALSALKDLDFTRMFPILGPGLKQLIIGGIKSSTIYADGLLYVVFFSYVRNFKQFKTGYLLGYTMNFLNFTTFLIIYLCMFGHPTINSIHYPFQMLNRAIKFGRFATNVEAIFLGFWVIASILRYTIYLYTSSALLAYTLGFKKIEKLLLPIAVVTVFVGGRFENYVYNVHAFREKYLPIMTPIFILYPFLLWILSKWKEAKSQ